MSLDVELLGAFAAVLRRRRKELKLSQEALAHWASVNRSFVAKIEVCKHQPTLTTIHQLAVALHTDMPSLLGETLRHYRPRKECAARPAEGVCANVLKRIRCAEERDLGAAASDLEDKQ